MQNLNSGPRIPRFHAASPRWREALLAPSRRRRPVGAAEAHFGEDLGCIAAPAEHRRRRQASASLRSRDERQIRMELEVGRELIRMGLGAPPLGPQTAAGARPRPRW